MPPLPTPLPALRSLTRIYAKPTSSHHLLRQSPLPRIQHQYQHLPLKRFTPSAFYSTTSSPSPLTSPPSSQATHKPKPHTPKPPQQTIPTPENPKPEYEMTFTCTPCSTRSSHRVSKQGYHKGSVLITCPECKNRHVISDHLGVRPLPPPLLPPSSLSFNIFGLLLERGDEMR